MMKLQAAAVGLLMTMAALSSVAAAPAREYATVTFRDPVKVLSTVLMGDYVIEHDDDRMARGGPCTAIYKAADLRRPVVMFHCKHLRRPAAATAQIALRRNPDMVTGFTLTAFQFAGSTHAHGVPLH
jgi:hypothetical protein